VPAPVDKPKNQGKNEAYKQRCCQRKIKDRVLATINNITRQAAKREMQLASCKQHGPKEQHNPADNEQ